MTKIIQKLVLFIVILLIDILEPEEFNQNIRYIE